MINYMIDHPKQEIFWLIVDIDKELYLNTKTGWVKDIYNATAFETEEDCIDYTNYYVNNNFLDRKKIKSVKIFAECYLYDGVFK